MSLKIYYALKHSPTYFYLKTRGEILFTCFHLSLIFLFIPIPFSLTDYYHVSIIPADPMLSCNNKKFNFSDSRLSFRGKRQTLEKNVHQTARRMLRNENVTERISVELTFEKLMLHSQSLQTNPEMSWGQLRNAIISEYITVQSRPDIKIHPRGTKTHDFSATSDRRS